MSDMIQKSIKDIKINDKVMFCRATSSETWSKNSFILGKVIEFTNNIFEISYEGKSKTTFDVNNGMIDVYFGQFNKIN